MSYKRTRNESIFQRNVLARREPSEREEREELKQQANELAESIPELSDIQQAGCEIDVSDLMAVVNLLLNYIQDHPVTSYDLAEDDDVARCTYELINQIIDNRIVFESQPAVHQALKENSDRLGLFFSVTTPFGRQFNPVLIDYDAADEESTGSYSLR